MSDLKRGENEVIEDDSEQRFVQDVRVFLRQQLEQTSARRQSVSSRRKRRIKGLVKAGPDFESRVKSVQSIRDYLKVNTLESHARALSLLDNESLTAYKVYDRIHRSGKHEFSKPSQDRVNHHFVEWISDHVTFTKDDVVAELGSGFGNDAIWLARNTEVGKVVGWDVSLAAISKAQEQAFELGVDDRVQFALGDHFKKMTDLKDIQCQAMVSHSTLHYHPGMVLREVTFPALAHILRQAKGEHGRLCFAMKTADSDSARPEKHLRLGEEPYYPSIDKEDGIFRVYPTVRAILNLLEPSFDLESCHTAHVPDYDVRGETEVFLCAIASAKKLDQR